MAYNVNVKTSWSIHFIHLRPCAPPKCCPKKKTKKRDKIYLSYFRIAGARTNRGWMEEIARGKRTIHTAEVESMSQEWRILERLKTTSQNILWVTAESFVVSINRKNMLYVNQRQNFRVHFSSVSTIALAYLRRTYIRSGFEMYICVRDIRGSSGRCWGVRIRMRNRRSPVRRWRPRTMVRELWVLDNTKGNFVKIQRKEKIITSGPLLHAFSLRSQNVGKVVEAFRIGMLFEELIQRKSPKIPSKRLMEIWRRFLFTLFRALILSEMECAFLNSVFFSVPLHCRRGWWQTICCNQPSRVCRVCLCVCVWTKFWFRFKLADKRHIFCHANVAHLSVQARLPCLAVVWLCL